MKLAVVGATGFVGSHVADLAETRGCLVTRIRAPRLTCSARSAQQLNAMIASEAAKLDDLAALLAGADVVVNAAGIATAESMNIRALFGANALLPGVIAHLCHRGGGIRLIHLSSAAVQGRGTLDESARVDPFSPYSRSKAFGEAMVMAQSREHSVLYRPTSVHGVDRSVTKTLGRFARGPLSSVAGDGNRPTPQVLVGSVADATMLLAEAAAPPQIALHPWEGMTTARLLRILSRGTQPKQIPDSLAKATLASTFALGRLRPQLLAQARRLEMLWFGQSQSSTWFQQQGWTGSEEAAWERLALQLSANEASISKSTAK